MKETLPLVARIHAELLAGMPKPLPAHETYLAETGRDIAIAFTEIIRIRQPWERALESLDAFLDAGRPKPEAARALRKARRLAWFVDPEALRVEAVEQSAKATAGPMGARWR